MLYFGVFVLVAMLATRRNVALWCNALAFATVAIATVALASRLSPVSSRIEVSQRFSPPR